MEGMEVTWTRITMEGVEIMERSAVPPYVAPSFSSA